MGFILHHQSSSFVYEGAIAVVVKLWEGQDPRELLKVDRRFVKYILLQSSKLRIRIRMRWWRRIWKLISGKFEKT